MIRCQHLRLVKDRFFDRFRLVLGRKLGIYSGQVDGILDLTQGAIEDYQLKNKLPVTGQPDQGLNTLLGVF